MNKLIQEVRNENTLGVEVLDASLESVLGLTLPRDRWQKASALLFAVPTGKVDPSRLRKFIQAVKHLIGSRAGKTRLAAEAEQPSSQTSVEGSAKPRTKRYRLNWRRRSARYRVNTKLSQVVP